MTLPEPDPNSRYNSRDIIALVVIILLLGIQFLWACHLNKQLYTVHGPFYDSMDYYGQVADNYHHIFEGDWPVALHNVLHRVNGMLEQLALLPLAWVFGYSRSAGIFIQSVGIFFLSVSLYHYFRTVHEKDRFFSFMLSLPFLSLGSIYNFNGGLSDFRVDLLLYLGIACSACWYLIARHRPERRFNWVALGICASATVLSRGTAPIYLALMIGPILCVDLLFSSRDRERFRSIVIGALITALICVVLTVWYFILNFDRLYYYYFIWNADANASLPLSVSSRHITFSFWHVDRPLLFGFVITGLISGVSILLRKEKSWRKLILLEGPAVWLWAAPLLFLVLRGAGLNPFVSMPAALGIVMGSMILVAYSGCGGISRILIVLAIGISCLASAATGVKKHYQPDINNASAYAKIRSLVEENAAPEGEITVGFYTCGWATGRAYRSYLLFDSGYFLSSGGLKKNGRIVNILEIAPAVLVDWEKLPGNDDEERIRSITSRLLDNADYILVPEPKTIEHLKTNLPFNYINLYTDRITDELLKSQQLEAISGEAPLVFNPQEKFRLYRNMGIR